MIKLVAMDLDDRYADRLRRYQQRLNGLGDYELACRRGATRFKSYNRAINPVFEHIRDKLKEMCPPRLRCMYCEEGEARMIDHFHPKSVYPDRVFMWENYIYVCHGCNQDKAAQFAIFDANDARIPVKKTTSPPPDGEPVLINPRFEDPLAWLAIDLNSGFVVPIPTLSVREVERAIYTIDVLNLNRDPLPSGRIAAFDFFLARLELYSKRRFDEPHRVFRKMLHQSVWQEMKRQTRRWFDFPDRNGTKPEFISLFEAIPEAMEW